MRLSKRRQHRYTWRNVLVFLLPSTLGAALFVVPVYHDGLATIPIAALAAWLQRTLVAELPALVTAIIVASALASLAVRWSAPGWLGRYPALRSLLQVSDRWLLMRVLGGVFSLLTLTAIGPEFIHSAETGGLVLHELMPVLFTVFILAGMALPLLLNFGLLELFGSLLTPVMRPLFRLPGRAAIDCAASWLGDGSVGVLLTSRQYRERQYTQREAAVIGTNFSAVSITFCLVVIAQVSLEHYFLQFYLTVCVAGLIAAVVVPRLPPLAGKPDRYIDGGVRTATDECVPAGRSLWSWGLERALQRAGAAGGAGQIVRQGLHTVADMLFGILPVVMAMGVVALVLAEYTPLFDWLGAPFVPLLEWLSLPEAQAASKTLMVGFADMFIPAIIAATIESELTRFVVACLSVTQLIYMSEVGALMLGSGIPVSFAELIAVFVLRTLVTLPVIALMAHWLI